MFLGLSIFAFGLINYHRTRILSFSKVPESVQNSVKENFPVRITIPSIKIDLAVDPGDIKDGVWQISSQNATFLSSSATPKSGGNIVIYGHNKKAIFGNLPYLSIGQKIYIKTKDEKIYVYEVYKKDFVGPGRVDLISPTESEELTVYTCWGIIDQSRAVVKAKPISS
jgi:LPXTG-site transpeptidase (sortase) family protein